MSAADTFVRPRREIAAAPLGAALAVCALVAAVLTMTERAPGVAAVLALPPFLLGLGFALLVRRSGEEPSLLKLGIVAWLLSPPLFAASLGAMSFTLEPPAALAATLVLVAALQVLSWGKRLGAEAPGGAALFAALLGVLLGAGVLALYAAAPVMALWGDGVWWAGAAGELATPLDTEDPWLAGTPLRHALGPTALLAAFARVLGGEPVAALPLLVAWPLVALPLALGFVAAPLWSEPRRVAASAVLGLLGGAAGVGITTWILGASRRVDGFGPLVEGLVGAPAGAEAPHGLPLAPLAAALVPGAAVAAWALAVLALLAGVHALRHGRKPWVGLAAVAVLTTWLLDPALGLTATLALGFTACITPGALSLLCAVGVGSLVGFAVQLGAVLRGPELVALGGPSPLPMAIGLGVLGLLALGAWPRLGGAAMPQHPGARPASERRTLVVLLVVTALVGTIVGLVDEPRGLLPGSASLLAQAALGVLAAGGLIGGFERRGFPRGVALVGAAVLGVGVLGSVWNTSTLLRAATKLDARATLAAELHEAPYDGGPFGPAWPMEEEIDLAGLERDRALAWRRLAERATTIEPPPVLVLGEAQEAQRLRHAPVPHVAPLLAKIPLWTDRSVPHTREHPRHERGPNDRSPSLLRSSRRRRRHRRPWLDRRRPRRRHHRQGHCRRS